MLLADMGAELNRVDRADNAERGVPMPARYNLMNRSRPTIAVDLKRAQGRDLVLRLCEGADALFEGFRPGVMERLEAEHVLEKTRCLIQVGNRQADVVGAAQSR